MTKYAQIAKRLPKFLYKTISQAWIDEKFPRHIFIELTATCNLTCDYCPRPRIRADMDFQLFQKIVDEASEYGARSFSLHLFGEPLLYPRIFDAIRYIKTRNKGHTVLLTTNGTKINELLDDLKSSKVDKVIWTWRTESKFTKKTEDALKNWNKFYVRVIEGTAPESEVIKWPRLERRKMHNVGGQLSFAQSTEGQRWPCYHLWLAPAVNWNGKMLICCVDPKGQSEIGDVNSESVAEIWKRFKGIRKDHLNGSYNGICRECNVWREYPDMFYGFQKNS